MLLIKSSLKLILLLCLFILNAQAQYSTTGPTRPPDVDKGIRPATRNQVIIPGVPFYLWHHGCGPTALGMVIGYYDLHGFRFLVKGNASSQTPEVDSMIAIGPDNSICPDNPIPGVYSNHFYDYCCPIDSKYNILTDKSELGDAHPDNCVADFMRTSRSSYSLAYGWSWDYMIDVAFKTYINFIAPQYSTATSKKFLMDVVWEDYKAEIDAGRPVVFLVDTDRDGITDHFVTGVGYEEDSGIKYYGCHDTWDDEIHWYQWRHIEYSVAWGIYSMTEFHINYTPKVIHTPAEYASIQAAVRVAEEGDTILVADGIYSEPGNRDIIMEGRPVILSEYGPEATIIDCDGTETEPHQAFIIENGVGQETEIVGFTFRNGYSAGNGGAIECWSSSPTIEDCIFENNRAVNGGAIYIENDASPEIRSCTFTNNQGIQGGAIYFGQYSNAIIEDCIISQNSASDGGGFYNNVSAPTIRECIFVENSAVNGGAIYNSRRGGPIVNCNFSLNSAEYGSGIAFSLASNTVDIQNSIIAFNTGGEAIYCPNPDRVPTLECTDIFGNSGGDWTNGIENKLGQDGNISSNPLFCDMYNIDFGLYINSPCAAENNECGVLIGVMDVGCLTEYIIGDADGNGEIGVNDIVYLIEYYFNGGARPVPHVAGDLSCDGWVGLVDIIMLNDYFFHSAQATGCQ